MIKVNKWLPAILVMAVIFVISSTPGDAIQKVGLGYEPIHVNGHFLLFSILCVAFYKATKDTLLSVVLTVFYGVVDEIHQMYTPLRSSSIKDIVVDTLGALLAGLILWKLQHILPKKLKNWLNN